MSDKSAVNDLLEAHLPGEETPAERLREAMNYSFTAGGKRLRPRLMAMTYEAFGGDGPVVEPFMAAVTVDGAVERMAAAEREDVFCFPERAGDVVRDHHHRAAALEISAYWPETLC